LVPYSLRFGGGVDTVFKMGVSLMDLYL